MTGKLQVSSEPVTPAFLHDVLMSLHRRAYTWQLSGAKRTHWYDHMETLCRAYADHPCYRALDRRTDAWDQIWQTAWQTIQGDLCPRVAFPLAYDLEQAGQSHLIGDLRRVLSRPKPGQHQPGKI